MNLSSKEQKLIINEIRSWQEEQLISAQQAELLIGRYAGSCRKPNITGILSLIGAVLIGLGVLLFIGANWDHMVVATKLTIIVLAIVMSNYFGWRFCYEPGTHPKLGAALLLLGGLCYGAGIWLIAQIFNMPPDSADGLLLWAAGTTATTLITRSIPLGCLSSILIGMWTFAQADCAIFEKIAQSAPHFSIFYSFLLASGCSLAIAMLLRSRLIAWIALAMGSIWMLGVSPLDESGLLIWGQLLFGCYLWCRKKHQLFSSPFLYISSLSTFGALLAFTCDKDINASSATLGLLVSFQVCAIVLLLLVLSKNREYVPEVSSAIGLVLVGGIFGGVVHGNFIVLFNIVLLVSVAATVYAGLNRLHSAGLVNVALVFFVLDVVFRYFDIFFSMMDRSLFFIVGGIVLMAAGIIAETGRRRMMQSLESQPVQGGL